MVNKVILVGNVGADPEVRTFEDGSKMARINVATTERIYNSKTQERTERTEWHRVTLWRGLATVAEQYVRKGSQVYVEGRIRTSEWTDANGQKRTGVEIQADNMNLLGRRSQSNDDYSSHNNSNNNYNRTAATTPSRPAPVPSSYTEPAEVDYSKEADDDLPF